jgi:hypothetical protein
MGEREASAAPGEDGTWLRCAIVAATEAGLQGRALKQAIFSAMSVDRQHARMGPSRQCSPLHDVEKVLAVAAEWAGRPHSVGSFVRVLRQLDLPQLASRLQRWSKVRNAIAHPDDSLVGEVAAALRGCYAMAAFEGGGLVEMKPEELKPAGLVAPALATVQKEVEKMAWVQGVEPLAGKYLGDSKTRMHIEAAGPRQARWAPKRRSSRCFKLQQAEAISHGMLGEQLEVEGRGHLVVAGGAMAVDAKEFGRVQKDMHIVEPEPVVGPGSVPLLVQFQESTVEVGLTKEDLDEMLESMIASLLADEEVGNAGPGHPRGVEDAQDQTVRMEAAAVAPTERAVEQLGLDGRPGLVGTIGGEWWSSWPWMTSWAGGHHRVSEARASLAPLPRGGPPLPWSGHGG